MPGSVHSLDSGGPPSLSFLYLALLFHVMSFETLPSCLPEWFVSKFPLERPGIVFHSCISMNPGNLSNFLKMAGEMGLSKIFSAGKARPLSELLDLRYPRGLGYALL